MEEHKIFEKIKIFYQTLSTILYTKCIQEFVEMWNTFCKHFVYILYASIVYIL